MNKNKLSSAVSSIALGTVVAGTAIATGGNNQWILATNSTSASGATSAGANATIYSGNITVSGSTITYNSPIGDSNATTDYLLGANTTLTFASNNTLHYGNVDAHTGNQASQGAGTWRLPNVIVAGNLTMLGNVGSGNTTGNWTINTGNTLTIASNASAVTFKTGNISIEQHSTLNLGNSTSGYNRASGDALTLTSNITMASNSTINIGNGTTITGDIAGASEGQGTVNIVGNFTSGGNFGDITNSTASGNSDLAQVNISAGNTFTIGNAHNVTATRMNINGTVTAYGASNITGTVTMGSGSVLNLTNNGVGGAAARVTGAIDGYAGSTGTLNVNGTWTTAGVIGGTRAIATINLDNNATTTGHTYTFAHSVNATTINLGHSSTSKNATLQTTTDSSTNEIVITGSIVGSTNASATDNAAGGRFLAAANTTVTGSIGTATTGMLGDIRVEDGTTLTMTGSGVNIYANNITLMDLGNNLLGTNNATLAFNGTGTTNVYGIIAGETTEGDGLIDINAGTVSFNSTVGTNTNYISAINVATGSNMTTMSNIYANDTIKILGTLDINQSEGITITANDAHGDGGGLQIGNTSGTNGTLETSGTITLSSNTTANVDNPTVHSFNNATIKINGSHASHITSGTGYIEIGANNQTVVLQGNTTINLDLTNTVATDGLEIVIIGRGSDTNSNGTLNVSGNVSAYDNYGMFDIAINNSTAFSAGYASDVANASLNATVTYTSSATLGYTGNTKSTYDGAKTAIGSDTAIFQALAGMSTTAAVKAAIETLEPDASGGSAAAVAMISSAHMNTIGDRLMVARRNHYGLSGMSAGDDVLNNALWLQAFGSDIEQDTVGDISGYDADGAGLVLGIDGLTDDGVTRIGIAGSYAETDVAGKDSTRKDDNDIDTTQITGYFRNDYEGYYVDGAISLANNDNTISRNIVVGSVSRTATASYDSSLTAFRIGAGWPMKEDSLTTTPTLGLTWSHLETDAYTETGAGNMNLTVTPDDIDTAEIKAGISFTGESTTESGGTMRPQFRLAIVGDLLDETADSTATFAGGGSSFNTTGLDKDEVFGDIGLGFTYTNPQGDTDISVDADGRFSDSYTQYGGKITVNWKF